MPLLTFCRCTASAPLTSTCISDSRHHISWSMLLSARSPRDSLLRCWLATSIFSWGVPGAAPSVTTLRQVVESGASSITSTFRLRPNAWRR
ncbi:hypothetical protein D3C75_1202770 [compost metagenome]